MLEVSGLEAGYGASQVLFGIDLTINAGEVVTLLGRNGMGKSTTVHSIMGLLSPAGGDIRFEGQSVCGQSPYAIARLGLGLVPEGRQIFPNLTVRENLLATAVAGKKTAHRDSFDMPRVLSLFPSLQRRLDNMGNQLSGGEQQMLAIARALMTNPRLLILDEATEGLAPMVRQQIWRVLSLLKGAGQAILLIDKNINALLRIGDRHYMVEKGRNVWEGDSKALRSAQTQRRRYLGV
ncbi:MAG: ATP-binding cassette domain-containing protein [Gammaproteobacteria bacterium]|nr:ATP-binding cassette domain-containing protein [Gammaproteobacteria bacterium]